jgi:hypothetical protein
MIHVVNTLLSSSFFGLLLNSASDLIRLSKTRPVNTNTQYIHTYTHRLSFFLEDDELLADIGSKYGSGAMLTGEIKKILIGVLTVCLWLCVSESVSVLKAETCTEYLQHFFKITLLQKIYTTLISLSLPRTLLLSDIFPPSYSAYQSL